LASSLTSSTLMASFLLFRLFTLVVERSTSFEAASLLITHVFYCFLSVHARHY
jgi:hypothetical protein